MVKKLSRDKPENTTIMAGQTSFTVEQLENEVKSDSEMGRKVKNIERILAERFEY